MNLREISLCAVPANPNALAIAKSLGVSTATIRRLFKQQQQNDPVAMTAAERVQRAREITQRAREILARGSSTTKPALLTMTAETKARLARAKASRAKAMAALKRADRIINDPYNPAAAHAKHAVDIMESVALQQQREAKASQLQEPPLFVWRGTPIYRSKGRFGW